MPDETGTWKPAESLDAVRDEVRNAIFWTIFQATAAEVEGRPDAGVGRQKAAGFVEFGVRSGLLTPGEGNKWLDAVWGRNSLANVSAECVKEAPLGGREPCRSSG